jgi:putative DNA methylase
VRIPLEALRVGADAFASDLNPVPVLLNKVILEYIPRYKSKLADAVREWGAWIKSKAEKQLTDLYPKDPDGAASVAYLWARTVLSEAPTGDALPVQIPLLRSLWLSKRKDNLRALRWVRDARGAVKTKVSEIDLSGKKQKLRLPLLEIFTPTNIADVEAGSSKGGAAICPVTGFTTSAGRVKEQLKKQHGGAQNSRLYGVYVDGVRGREFRLSSDADIQAFQAAAAIARKTIRDDPDAFPTEPINPIRPFKNTRGLSAITRIGCESFGEPLAIPG